MGAEQLPEIKIVLAAMRLVRQQDEAVTCAEDERQRAVGARDVDRCDRCVVEGRERAETLRAVGIA